VREVRTRDCLGRRIRRWGVRRVGGGWKRGADGSEKVCDAADVEALADEDELDRGINFVDRAMQRLTLIPLLLQLRCWVVERDAEEADGVSAWLMRGGEARIRRNG
jgi:hypothetical protein